MTSSQTQVSQEKPVNRLYGRAWGGAWLTILLVTVFAALIGNAYELIFYPDDEEQTYHGARVGASIAFVSSLIEIFYIRSQRRSWIRRVAFLPGIIVRILVLTMIVRLSLVGNEFLSDWLQGRPLAMDNGFAAELRDTLISMALVIVFVAISQLGSIIGVKRFSSLVVGRYFRPQEEARIFMFIDLIDSSRLARELGDVRFHNFLSEFFYLADEAIVRSGGEIVSYVGDAVIVTWPISNRAERNARCLKALRNIIERMKANEPYFISEFGKAARFRAAVHCGPVVIGECGDSRRQITFLGDVVNMTARIEQVSKDLGQDYVASRELTETIPAPKGMRYDRIAKVPVKGAEDGMDLYRIRFDAATA